MTCVYQSSSTRLSRPRWGSGALGSLPRSPPSDPSLGSLPRSPPSEPSLGAPAPLLPVALPRSPPFITLPGELVTQAFAGCMSVTRQLHHLARGARDAGIRRRRGRESTRTSREDCARTCRVLSLHIVTYRYMSGRLRSNLPRGGMCNVCNV